MLVSNRTFVQQNNQKNNAPTFKGAVSSIGNAAEFIEKQGLGDVVQGYADRIRPLPDNVTSTFFLNRITRGAGTPEEDLLCVNLKTPDNPDPTIVRLWRGLGAVTEQAKTQIQATLSELAGRAESSK